MAAPTTMRLSPLRLSIALLFLLSATPGWAFSDAELINGFDRTVFGSEYPRHGWQSRIVKKFVKPVRVYVDDRSGMNRAPEVRRFVRTLPSLIAGLDIALVAKPSEANFRVFVLDQVDYLPVIAREIDGQPTSTFAPGACLVRVAATPQGILRSDAVIVSDKGDFLFRRCMVEEILQGLGPINDDRTLSESVFNDYTRQTAVTNFDRHLMNMLYHPLIRPGMSRAAAGRVLPVVTAEVQARLR